MKKKCVTCESEFETNYKTKITCSEKCKVIRKNEVNRVRSKQYYNEKKAGTTNKNLFLSLGLKNG